MLVRLRSRRERNATPGPHGNSYPGCPAIGLRLSRSMDAIKLAFAEQDVNQSSQPGLWYAKSSNGTIASCERSLGCAVDRSIRTRASAAVHRLSPLWPQTGGLVLSCVDRSSYPDAGALLHGLFRGSEDVLAHVRVHPGIVSPRIPSIGVDDVAVVLPRESDFAVIPESWTGTMDVTRKRVGPRPRREWRSGRGVQRKTKDGAVGLFEPHIRLAISGDCHERHFLDARSIPVGDIGNLPVRPEARLDRLNSDLGSTGLYPRPSSIRSGHHLG